MIILKLTSDYSSIEAPDYNPVSRDIMVAAMDDSGQLRVVYSEPQSDKSKVVIFTFNRYETQKIRSVLSKGGIECRD